MPYKPSNYNHFVELENQETVLFNFLNRGLFQLDADTVGKIEYILAHSNEELEPELEELKGQLIANHFLIPADHDELDVIRTRNMSKRFGSSMYRLMVMPTLDCNFGCTYCYETREQGFISDSLKEGIVNWSKTMTDQVNHMLISWFGGEPLMDFATVEEVNRQVMDICKGKNCDFSSIITTNGYLLDDEMIGKMDELAITGAQITVDGPAEYHDKYRPLRNGRGTYDVIMKNIYRLLDETNVVISFRVNVNAENYPYIGELMDSIPEKYRTDRLQIYFRKIYGSNNLTEENQAALKNQCLRTVSYLDLYKQALAKGYHIQLPMFMNRDRYCDSCFHNYLVVHPNGNLFKCTFDFDEKERVGVLQADGEVEIDQYLYSQWMAPNSGDDEKCTTCKFLPMCHGGCRYGKTHQKDNNCPYEVEDLNGFIELLYLSAQYGRPLAG